MKKKELLNMILLLQDKVEDLEEKITSVGGNNRKGCPKCGLSGMSAFTCTRRECPRVDGTQSTCGGGA